MKHIKRILAIFLAFFYLSTFFSIAQDYQDVVYLKNGNIVRGELIELIPHEYVDIKLSNGRIRSIDMENIERIVKEQVRPDTRTQTERRENVNQNPSNSNNVRSNAITPQNNARVSQNNDRYAQDNYDRYAQNNVRYNSRNRYNDDYDDGYFTRQKNVYYGLKGGLNIATFSNLKLDEYGELENLKYRYALHGGLFAEFKFNNFAIQPELLFSMQGFKVTGLYDELDASYYDKYNFNYFSIPVMAKYYIIDGLCIEIGPQLGFLLSAKEKLKNIGDLSGDEDLSGTEDIKAYFKEFDFSLNFGASYQIPNLPFGFYMRYSLGLTDVNKNTYDDDEYGIVKNQNRVFQAGVFYKF